MRVFLTGFMGAGKTSVGRPLADRLGVPFFDLDAEIEQQTGRTVPEIFAGTGVDAGQGEKEFRRLELEVLDRLVELPDLVLATGGGTLTQEVARRRLVAAGPVVWLNPAFTTLVARLRKGAPGDRPLFQDEDQARQLYEARLGIYGRCDVRVDVRPTEEPEEVAARIEQLLKRRASGLS